MNRIISASFLAAGLAGPAVASDLNLTVESGGSSSITASPGATIDYTIVGELSDNLNEGLAMFALDLEFTGGPLGQADEPAELSIMDSFSKPEGVTNPAGFGGTPDGTGKLEQIGGAQNTILNSFGSYPIGGVSTGVAANGAPQVLATGSVTVPDEVGTYTLRITNVQANVIRQGETGFPFYEVERAGQGTVIDLDVDVIALTQDASTVSAAAGGTVTMSLDAGPSHAGQLYFLVGSWSGTSPGSVLSTGLVLPLNTPDFYFDFTVFQPNTVPLVNSLNFLDGMGKGTVLFTLDPGVAVGFEGLVFYHAYATVVPIDFVSNAQAITIVP